MSASDPKADIRPPLSCITVEALNHCLICIKAVAECLGFSFYERWKSPFIGACTRKYFFTVRRRSWASP